MAAPMERAYTQSHSNGGYGLLVRSRAVPQLVGAGHLPGHLDEGRHHQPTNHLQRCFVNNQAPRHRSRRHRVDLARSSFLYEGKDRVDELTAVHALRRCRLTSLEGDATASFRNLHHAQQPGARERTRGDSHGATSLKLDRPARGVPDAMKRQDSYCLRQLMLSTLSVADIAAIDNIISNMARERTAGIVWPPCPSGKRSASGVAIT